MKNIIITICLIFYIFVETKVYIVDEPNNLYYKEGEKILLDKENWTIIKLMFDLTDINYKEITL